MSNEVAYLAGLFDGEGCVTIRKMFYKPKHQYQALLSVMMCSEKAVKLFFERWGGSFVERDRKPSEWKVCWQWSVTGTKTIFILEELLPYLVVKRDEAVVALAFEKYRQKLVLSLPRGGPQRRYPDSYHVFAQTCYDEIRRVRI